MDFRTEWSSWVLVLIMLVITAFVAPYLQPDAWDAKGIALYVFYIIAFVFLLVAMASIPVLIVCYIVKVIPDIDYSIRLAFAFMVVLWIMHIL